MCESSAVKVGRGILHGPWSALLAGALGLMIAASASAQDWPNKPVKIVVAVAAGSSGDTLARMLAPKLEAVWKQPVIVENKPGAGGILGTEYVINSNDGHTMILATQSSILPKYTQKDVRFDPHTDLMPVFKVIHYQMVMATNATTSKKAKTLAEFVALSKSTDKGLFLAGTGKTSIFNVSVAILNQSLGIRYESVDFNSVAAMNLAVIKDEAQFMVNTPSSIKGHFDSGGLIPLVAVSTERYPNLPDVPSLTEAIGYKGYIPVLWAGIMMPKGTSAPVIEKISRDLLAVTSDAALKKQVESTLSGTLVRSSPTAFANDIREETNAWKEVFQKMNFKPE